MKGETMNYHNITKDDMLNGDGLRVVLWVSGCNHNCPGCHNPQTHDPNSGLLFTQETFMEIITELEKEHVSGVTLSGGDPLFPSNRESVLDIVKTIKHLYPNKTIWLYTGYDWNDIYGLPLMKYVDVVVEGRFIKGISVPSPKWRGSSNQRVINVNNELK